MNENSIVKLKEDYVFFQDEEYICVYQKSTKLVVLKLKVGANAYSDSAKEDLKRPHKMQWLAKQTYWNWLGIAMLKYPNFFEELSESEADKCVKKTDYFSVVNRTHFAENYQVDSSFAKTRIFLWGNTSLNKLLYDNMKETVSDIYLIKNEEDMIDENSFLAIAGEEALEQKIVSERMIFKDELAKLGVTKDDLFFVDATGLSADKLVEISDYVVSKNAVSLFYGNTNKEVVIGPLVIGGESACIHCMQNQGILDNYYSGENSFLDRATSHLFMYFITRILYYIKDNNLYYLLSDAQIPINKVMTVSKENITAKMRYLHRDTECSCCK